ncbi:hypothetical protein HZH68_012801 [Vespula germanica]|uniref:Uncharacterized protein n=1 Tax=Vespula germanica TaxID=30212 RepID=A0A834MXB7_VESGE|nr:hypothetical protein HZH68_012801 [Vespula germanica]
MLVVVMVMFGSGGSDGDGGGGGVGDGNGSGSGGSGSGGGVARRDRNCRQYGSEQEQPEAMQPSTHRERRGEPSE